MSETNNGGVYIESSINNQQLAVGAQQARQIIQSIGQTAQKVGVQIDNSLTPDSKQMRVELDNAKKKLQELGNSAEEECNKIDGVFRKMAAGLGAVFTVQKALEFGKSMMQVRAEVERFEISFATLLGNKEKADEMFGAIRQFAATTPMMLKDLASAAQTMLGFNIETEKVIPMLKAIGDISICRSNKL